MPPLRLAGTSLKVTQARIDRYARLTGDPNPIHLDAAFAATTGMGGIIAHGTLSMNLLWQALEATFGADGIAGICLDIRFVRPVRVDDVVTASGEPADEPGVWQVRVANQAGEAVIDGHAYLPD